MAGHGAVPDLTLAEFERRRTEKEAATKAKQEDDDGFADADVEEVQAYPQLNMLRIVSEFGEPEQIQAQEAGVSNIPGSRAFAPTHGPGARPQSPRLSPRQQPRQPPRVDKRSKIKKSIIQ